MLKSLPNAITILRALLAIPLLWFLITEQYIGAIWTIFIAGLSDGADGFLAKRFDVVSEFGGMLDPLADKFLLLCAYFGLAWIGALPWWLAFAVVGRDILIVAGATAYHYLVAPFEASPSLLSKLNTVTQMLLVVIVLVDRAWYELSPVVIDVSVIIVALTTVLSGVQYVWEWGRRARRSSTEAKQ